MLPKVCSRMFWFIASLTLVSNSLYANNAEPPHQGNFALPFSQQPGAFISFGQNVIGKNQKQLQFGPAYTLTNGGSFTNFTGALVYGITDNLSILLSQPYAYHYTSGGSHSSGFEDTTVQLEYAYYNKDTASYSEYATVIGAVTSPTGSPEDNPTTGLGSESYFVGGVVSRIYVEWLEFVSFGLNKKSTYHDVLQGTQYLYQGGLERVFKSAPNKYIFAGILELNGTYTDRTEVSGIYYHDSGGNLIYFTPSIWYSDPKIFVQLGVSLPINQYLYGSQTYFQYVATATVGYTAG